MNHLTVIDLFIILVFSVSMLLGFVRGFIREVMALTMYIISFIVATFYSHSLARYLLKTEWFKSLSGVQNNVEIDASLYYLAVSISYFLIFVCMLLVGFIITSLINMVLQIGFLGFTNRLLGALFGLLRAVVLTFAIIFIIEYAGINMGPVWQKSYLMQFYKPLIIKTTSLIDPYFSQLKKDWQEKTKKLMTQEPSKNNFLRYTP